MKIKTFVSASLSAVTVLACSLCAREAHAQRVVVEPAPRPVVVEEDWARFRWGIDAGAGGLFASQFGAFVGGVDLRLGAQINNLIGVYAEPYLYGGTGKVAGGLSGATGTAGVLGGVDFTLLNHFFVGVGGGYGVVENPTGPVFEVRGGFYPVVGHRVGSPRRHGFMIGAAMKANILSQSTNVVQLTGNIGYEAF